jgi:hypothetical protein
MTYEEALKTFEYKDGLLYWLIDTGKKKTTGKVAGTKREKGHIQIQYKGKIYRAHNIVWLMHNKELPKQIIDHINCNPSDNRIENLRLATNSQNLANRTKTKANTSGYKGVWWNNQLKKWSAEIKKDYKKYYLGSFSSAEEAHIVYKQHSKLLFKEFSRT